MPCRHMPLLVHFGGMLYAAIIEGADLHETSGVLGRSYYYDYYVYYYA